ncbi:hypothetical protein D3C80_1245600 [compost metagenome]
MVRAHPVLTADQVTRCRKQQSRRIAFADGMAHLRREHGVQVGKYHSVYLRLFHTQPGETFQQAQGRALAAAGARQRCQQRIGTRHDQGVQAVLLHQQHPGSQFDFVVVVRAQPLDPGAARGRTKQGAAIEPAGAACHRKQFAIHH